MNWLTHLVYLLCIPVAMTAGMFGGILIDQRYINKPAPHILTIKETPKPAELTVDCRAAMRLCKQTFRDSIRKETNGR